MRNESVTTSAMCLKIKMKIVCRNELNSNVMVPL